MALKPLDRIPLSLSLRTQLVLVTSMLIALAIAVTSLVAISALRAQMVHQLDEEMKTSAPALVQLATVRPSGKQEGSLSTYRVYLLDKDGKVLYSLSSEHDEQAGEPTLNGWTAEKVRKQNEEGVTVGSSSGSADWRLLAVPIEANDSSGLTEASSLIIAMPLKQTNQVVALVGVLTFAFGLATLASAIAMTWVIVTRTFEPLARVEQTAAKIAAGDLSQRIEDYKNGSYALAGGVVDPLPEDAPQFVKDYHSYYKTRRGYHPRSLNSGSGWNVTSSLPFINMPILQYSSEIRSAVLLVHGEKAHSRYFSEGAYEKLTGDNKELIIIPGANHVDLYDSPTAIPFEKLKSFFEEYLK